MANNWRKVHALTKFTTTDKRCPSAQLAESYRPAIKYENDIGLTLLCLSRFTLKQRFINALLVNFVSYHTVLSLIATSRVSSVFTLDSIFRFFFFIWFLWRTGIRIVAAGGPEFGLAKFPCTSKNPNFSGLIFFVFYFVCLIICFMISFSFGWFVCFRSILATT